MLEQIYLLPWEYKWTCAVAKSFLLTKIQLSALSFAPKGNSELCFPSCSWGFLQHQRTAGVEQCSQPASALGDKHCLKTQKKAELPGTVSHYRSRQLKLCWCITLCNSLEVDCTKEVSSGGQSVPKGPSAGFDAWHSSKKSFWLLLFSPTHLFRQFCSQSLSL